jgi:hypothetical protein
MFKGLVPYSAYSDKAAESIRRIDMGGEKCFDKLKKGFYDLTFLAQDKD